MNATQLWNAYQTIVIKEITRIVRIWSQTLLPPAITMSLYFVIFGSLIGGRIGNMDGIPYIDFIVPGLVMMSVITNSYSNTVSSFFGAKFGRYIEEMLASSVPTWIILAGYVTGSVVRGLAVGVAVLLVASAFTELRIYDLGVVVAIVLLTAVAFSLAGMINAIFARKFDDISIVPTFVLAPLTYLGGVFYTIDLLPDFWEKVSLANPILYMVNGFRFGLIGTSDVPLWSAFVVISLFVVVLGVVCWTLLHRGVGIRS